MIVGPPVDASSNQLADWLELEAFASESDYAPITAVNESLEVAEDYEPEELDEENIFAERRIQQAVVAIQERMRTMGNAYPFILDKSGARIQLVSPLTDAGQVYLFCLVVSNGASDGFLADEGPWKPDLVGARNLFQICATISAAGFVEGPAFSVGWPRPDATSFLDKLTTVYQLFGDGAAHPTPPPGAPRQVKDDEIDVIAWQYSDPPHPRTLYFLGQAASGADWDGKSLKGAVDTFHGTWFAQPPACHPKVGTIIPFVLPTEADAAADHENQDEIAGRLRRFTLRHDVVLYRHRVVHNIDKGKALPKRGKGPVERLDDLHLIGDYVNAYRTQLRAAVAGLQ